MVGNTKLNLVFVSSDQYPDGGAAVNRHMAYTKGLVEDGHDVTFVLLSKQIARDNDYSEGGIKYLTASPLKPIRNRNKLKKIILLIRELRDRNNLILKIHRKRKIDAIILLDTLVWILIPIIRLAKKNGIKIIHERTEYPFVVGGKALIMRVNLKIYLKYVLKKFNGIYVISQALKNYFNNILNNEMPIEIINMIVDPARFKVVAPAVNHNYQYIAYCGSLNDNKDGVDILIRAFGDALISGKIKNDIRLMLIGDIQEESFQKKLDTILEEKNCRNNIIFTGKVERSKVPELLIGAAALALARPESKQAEGGFPTKLGEYLATGKPVIITSTGEIGLFLKDSYNAFIARPGDVNSFSEKINEVFSDYPKALEIGKRGEMLIYNEFNYYKQALRLARFIESVEQL
jgi:glycosyltransferase involved in cell wall biosynthesis